MSKRGADEYITKENGSIPSNTETDKVKMATAAQLAKRKMAVPKSRAGRTGQSPMPGAGTSSPFSSNTMFGAPQNNQQPTFSNPGSTPFGASQSFPSGDTSNSGFNFSVPGQSSSFTFGQPTTNNPFANMNGNANNEQSAPETPDIMMESPQKKPAFGSNMFGSNNVNTSQPSGFSFGQPTSQPPSQPNFGFGQTQGFGNTAATSIFGQGTTTPPESSTPPNMFGQPAQSSNNASSASTLFGQVPPASQPQAQSSGFKFGQSTTSSTPSAIPAFSFGQPATSTPPASSPTPSFSFGATSSQPPSSAPLFGAAPASSQPSFGGLTQTSQPSSSPTLFAAPQSSTTNNIFGGFGGNKTAEPALQNGVPAVSEQPKPLFGQPASTPAQETKKPEAQDQPSSNPFAGLFGQSSTKKPEPAAASNSTSNPHFSFSAPVQPAGLFGAPKPANSETTPARSAETPQKPLFGLGASTAQTSSNLFSPVQSTPSSTNPSNPFAGLSTKKPDVSEVKTDKPLFAAPQQTVKSNDKSFKASPSFGQSHENKSAQDVQASKPSGFGGFGDVSKQQPLPASASATSQTLFGNASSATPKQQATPLFGNSNISGTKEQSPPVDLFTETARAAASLPSNTGFGGAKTPEHSSEPKRMVNTNPPTRVPPYLSGEDYKSYDSNYRLHSLNREFQKRIASLDPSREDFENIVRNYVAARESIGESIGLYTRNIAGMKRKPDEADDRAGSETNSSKRSKQTDEPQAPRPTAESSISKSVFQPVPSSSPAPFGASMNASTTKSATPAKPNTSSLFSSMIPDNKSSASAPTSNNPFANLPKTSSTAPDTANAKSQFSFIPQTNTTSSAGSTTPTKSPPKKAVFEMPKFAAPPAGNFMDAFKKQSDASAAKFAKEAKAKRKAEEFDSDEDDEEEWERKYDEEERAKKAKLAEVAKKGFMPTFANGATASSQPSLMFGNSTAAASNTTSTAPTFGFGKQDAGKSSDKPIDISDNDASGEDEQDEGTGDSQTGDDEDEDEEQADDDDLPEDEVDGEDDDGDEDLETTLANSRGTGKSLFERVTPNPNLQKETTAFTNVADAKEAQTKSNTFGTLFGQSTTKAPSSSPPTPAGAKAPYVPSKTFNFTPTPRTTSPAPAQGASIFAGGTMKDGPIAGEGLFGSRPSTPSNAEKPKGSLFGGFGTPANAGDHTWKKGSEIKFGQSTTEAPSLSITEPSPRKEEFKPFGSLFGGNSSATSDSSAKPNLGFNFAQSPVPGFLAAASHLTGGSGTTSGMSSRATSPGTTDNESVATNEEDYSHDDQVSLMEARTGEENEKVIFETRARALRFYKDDEIQGTKLVAGWNVVGLGIVRLLKHKETGKTRIVLRAEPGANVILNTNLLPGIKYESGSSGSNGTVKFQVITSEGPQGWTMKTKTHQQAQEMAKLMEENKKVDE